MPSGSRSAVDVREDIAALPWIAIHTQALWLPLADHRRRARSFIVVTERRRTRSASSCSRTSSRRPAIGGVFIAGFLAPRASWLLGVVVGFVVGDLLRRSWSSAFPTSISVRRTADRGSYARDVVVSALILSPIIGAFFAAAAAWYRRFLALSSPNRGNKKPSQTAKAKPGDGRTRTASSQKARAKR